MDLVGNGLKGNNNCPVFFITLIRSLQDVRFVRKLYLIEKAALIGKGCSEREKEKIEKRERVQLIAHTVYRVHKKHIEIT